MTSRYWWIARALRATRALRDWAHNVWKATEWRLFAQMSQHTIAVSDLRTGKRSEYRDE